MGAVEESLLASLHGVLGSTVDGRPEIYLVGRDADLEQTMLHLARTEIHLIGSRINLKNSVIHLEGSEIHLGGAILDLEFAEVFLQGAIVHLDETTILHTTGSVFHLEGAQIHKSGNEEEKQTVDVSLSSRPIGLDITDIPTQQIQGEMVQDDYLDDYGNYYDEYGNEYYDDPEFGQYSPYQYTRQVRRAEPQSQEVVAVSNPDEATCMTIACGNKVSIALSVAVLNALFVLIAKLLEHYTGVDFTS